MFVIIFVSNIFINFIKMTNKIKNIIFDLGGVLLDIDQQATIKKFENSGGIKEIFKHYEFFRQLELGLISPEVFRNELKYLFTKSLSNDALDSIWNAMIGDFRPGHVEYLLSLKKNYNTFLLSNTNKIHFDCFDRNIRKNYHAGGLSDLFHAAYYSFELKMRKPEREIFDVVIKDQQLVPIETLFIDDTFENIKGAKETGLICHHLIDGETILDIVDQYVNK